MAKQKTDSTNEDTPETTKSGITTTTTTPPADPAPAPEPTLADVNARLKLVEEAVHALDTHAGTSHTGFTNFVKGFRDRYWPKGTEG